MNRIVRQALRRVVLPALIAGAVLGLPGLTPAANAVPGYCVGFHDSGLGDGSVCTP